MGSSERVMDKELYKATINGDESFLKSVHDEEYFLKQTSQKNNYLHLAIRHNQFAFVNAALTADPDDHNRNVAIDKLLSHQNSDGNTPLHVAAEVGNIDIVERLLKYKKAYKGHRAELWRVQNNEGNTPLHLAFIYGNYEVAKKLLFKLNDPQLARVINNLEETPLHLAIRFQTVGNNEELIKMTYVINENQRSSTEGLLQGTHLDGVIKLLLQKDSSVACLRDTKGLTPLLRAASLEAPYDVQVIKLILDHHPQCAEVCDLSGKTILHHLKRKLSYQEAQELLEIAEIKSLVNYRDHNGDTPAHVVVRRDDMNFVRILLRTSAQFLLKNHEGVSAADLLKRKTKVVEAFGDGITELTEKDANNLMACDDVYLTRRLESEEKLILLSRDRNGSNILHYLAQSRLWESDAKTVTRMIKKILNMYPDLLWQTNDRGQNPAHSFAAQSLQFYELEKLEAFESVLDLFDKCYQKVKDVSVSPWTEKDENGDNPLHVSLKSISSTHQLKPAMILWEKHPELASKINHRGELPFHLLADIAVPLQVGDKIKHSSNIEELEKIQKEVEVYAAHGRNIEELGKLMPLGISGERYIAYITHAADVDGLTAFQRAVKSCSSYLTHIYCKKEPRVIFQRFPDDRNTALHFALEKQRFKCAILYLETAAVLHGGQKNQHELLEMPNSKGVTPADLIGQIQFIPSHFENFLMKEDILAGTRSMYGVPMVKIDAYTSTIGVIAALLATVSFTAGFTVPGGSNDGDGTPILLKKVAFQVFMVANTLALCFSMMVLFCLLLIMSTQNRKESILLVDTSIFLLELSFYSTLVTFMAGVYVTTINITPWMAILPCCLCSLLIIIMHKWFIKNFLSPICIKSVKRKTHFKTIVKEKILDKICGSYWTNIFKCSTNSRKHNNVDQENP